MKKKNKKGMAPAFLAGLILVLVLLTLVLLWLIKYRQDLFAQLLPFG
jgi:cell division septal protein FtsQ